VLAFTLVIISDKCVEAIRYNSIVDNQAYILDKTLLASMATMIEHPERYGWWINELESLGLSVKKMNELNDLHEIRDLAENIKQDKYIHYKTDYFSDINPNL
jgi:hypothetical protein